MLQMKAKPHIQFTWLSLDESDNDYARFLAYIIAALNQAKGNEVLLWEKVR